MMLEYILHTAKEHIDAATPITISVGTAFAWAGTQVVIHKPNADILPLADYFYAGLLWATAAAAFVAEYLNLRAKRI